MKNLIFCVKLTDSHFEQKCRLHVAGICDWKTFINCSIGHLYRYLDNSGCYWNIEAFQLKQCQNAQGYLMHYFAIDSCTLKYHSEFYCCGWNHWLDLLIILPSTKKKTYIKKHTYSTLLNLDSERGNAGITCMAHLKNIEVSEDYFFQFVQVGLRLYWSIAWFD